MPGVAAIGLRLELFGEHDFGRVSGYADLAMGSVYRSGTGDSPLHGGAGKATAELGVLYGRLWHRHPARRWGWLVRAGAYAPLVHDDDKGYQITSALVYEQLPDAVVAYPHSAGLRTSGTLYGAMPFGVNSGTLFFRVNAGLDGSFDLSDASDIDRQPDPLELVGRLDLGGGVAVGSAVFSMALANNLAAALPEPDRLGHAASASIRYREGRLQPYGGITVPLDAAVLGDDTIVFVGLELADQRL